MSAPVSGINKGTHQHSPHTLDVVGVTHLGLPVEPPPTRARLEAGRQREEGRPEEGVDQSGGSGHEGQEEVQGRNGTSAAITARRAGRSGHDGYAQFPQDAGHTRLPHDFRIGPQRVDRGVH